MSKEVISNGQGMSLVALFIMGSTLVLPTGVEAGRDLWIAIIVAAVWTLPVLFMYARLHVLYPGQDLVGILEQVLGRVVGKLVGLIFVGFAFYLGAIVLRNFGEYMRTVGLPETPQIFPVTIFILLCLWGVKEGVETLGRWGQFFLVFSLMLIFSTIALMTSRWEIANLQPMLYNGWRPVFKGATSVLSFPFAETVIMTMAFAQVKRRNSPYRIYLYGFLIGAFVVWLTSISELLILSINLYESTYFPSYLAVSLVNVGDFIQRMEIIPAVAFLTGGFIKISLCLLGTCRGFARIIGFEDYRFLVTPVALMMANVSFIIYENIIEMFVVISLWPYIALPIQIGLPVLIWVIAEIKARLGKGQSTS